MIGIPGGSVDPSKNAYNAQEPKNSNAARVKVAGYITDIQTLIMNIPEDPKSYPKIAKMLKSALTHLTEQITTGFNKTPLKADYSPYTQAVQALITLLKNPSTTYMDTFGKTGPVDNASYTIEVASQNWN